MYTYKYAAVIGIDGMGSFNRLTDTPWMDVLFDEGAVTYDALSMDPTISAQNWGAMLVGADPIVHGMTNGSISQNENLNEDLPSVFKLIRAAYPDAPLASVCNWDPINFGIIENGLGVDKRTGPDDAAVCDEIIDALAAKPKFLFVQFDDVDGAGHGSDYGSERHLEQIRFTDDLVGKVVDEYKRLDMFDETLFIVIADHGGIRRGHGGYSDEEKYVFFGVAGKGVKKGEIAPCCTKDVAAIVLTALGVPVPAYDPDGFSSQVPAGIFEGIGDDYIQPDVKSYDRQGLPSKKYDAPDGLGTVFADRVGLCLFFDMSLDDETRKHRLLECSRVKFYNDGFRGSWAEFGRTGCVMTPTGLLGSSFSVAFWAEPQNLSVEYMGLAVCGNKTLIWERRFEKGFNINLRNHGVNVKIGKGDDEWEYITPFPGDGYKGMFHTVISFDFDKKTVSTFFNFKRIQTVSVTDDYLSCIDNGSYLFIGDDCMERFNRTRGATLRLDDFIVFRGAFADGDAEKLKEYYDL